MAGASDGRRTILEMVRWSLDEQTLPVAARIDAVDGLPAPAVEQMRALVPFGVTIRSRSGVGLGVCRGWRPLSRGGVQLERSGAGVAMSRRSI